MTQDPTGRDRRVPGLALDIDDVIDTLPGSPIWPKTHCDSQTVAIIWCAEVVAHYVEQLHAPHGLDQFLTPAECGEVAAFVGSLGANPGRENEFFERRTGLSVRDRNPGSGWTAETAREAAAQASARRDDTALPDYARECFALLACLVDYLDALSGPAGFRDLLTPAERAAV